MAKTDIEQMIGVDRVSRGLWWGRPWGLVHGCTKVSDGCKHCWAEANTSRWREVNPELYFDLVRGGHWTNKIRLLELKLLVPRRARKPAVWALWNDLFHPVVPDRFILNVHATTKYCPNHIFQILTKRPKRAAQMNLEWPSNVWFGTSIEDQPNADKRIIELLKVRAGLLFVSIEPMLKKLSIADFLPFEHCKECNDTGHPWIDTGNELSGYDYRQKCRCVDYGLDWVILGCESGPRRRSMKLEWVRNIIKECGLAQIPAFVKQLPINGKVCHDMSQFPADLQIREFPDTAQR